MTVLRFSQMLACGQAHVLVPTGRKNLFQKFSRIVYQNVYNKPLISNYIQIYLFFSKERDRMFGRLKLFADLDWLLVVELCLPDKGCQVLRYAYSSPLTTNKQSTKSNAFYT